MCCILNYIKKCILFLTSIAIVVLIGIILFILTPPVINTEIMHGYILLVIAIVTSYVAIKKYQHEQRVLRIQKLYFEDTFNDLARSIDDLMAQTKRNRHLLENLLETIEVCKSSKIDILSNSELKSILNDSIKNIKTDAVISDFKKETLSSYLYEATKKENKLPMWIKDFEDDVYKLAYLLRGQIFLLKNRENFDDFENLIKYLINNFKLVERHYILLTLFSEITFKVSLGNYSSIKHLVNYFHNSGLCKINNLANETYLQLISPFKRIHIGEEISSEDSKKIDKAIEICRKNIGIQLFPK